MIWLALPLLVAGLLILYHALGIGPGELWSTAPLPFAATSPPYRILQAALGLLLLGAGVALVVRGPLRGASGSSAQRWRVALAVVLGLSLSYLVLVELGEHANILSRTTDFGVFYRAAELVAQGQDPYAGLGGAYFYPPVFAHLFRPFTLLPIAWASVVWFVLKLGLVAAMTRWTYALLRGSEFGPRARVLFAFGILATTGRFWIADLEFGNSNIPIAALVIGLIYLDRRDRPLQAGLALAAATAIKVVPGLLLLWLVAQRRWTTILASGVALVILCSIPFWGDPAAGLEQWRSYLDTGVTAKLAEDLGQPTNQSLRGVLTRALPSNVGFAHVLWALLSAMLVAYATWLSWRTRDGSAAARALVAAIFSGLLLVVSPGSWVVHYVGAMLATSALLRLVMDGSEPRKPYLAVFAAANVVFTASGWSRMTVRLSIEHSWFFFALALNLACLAFAVESELRGRSPGEPASSRLSTPG